MSPPAAPLTAAPANEASVPSPCINICRMDPERGLCEGCLRTIDEIVAWSRLSEAGKQAVWNEIARRRGA